jgi:hypothetical protein
MCVEGRVCRGEGTEVIHHTCNPSLSFPLRPPATHICTGPASIVFLTTQSVRSKSKLVFTSGRWKQVHVDMQCACAFKKNGVEKNLKAQNVTAQEIFDVLTVASQRPQWDGLCQECTTIETLDVNANGLATHQGQVAADVSRMVMTLQDRKIDFVQMRCANICISVACILVCACVHACPYDSSTCKCCTYVQAQLPACAHVCVCI